MAVRAAETGPSDTSRVPLASLVFVVAFAARLAMVYVRGGSLHDSTSYDPSVYYAAADALLHGRLPYRDFTLLHPPGLMLALTPFALLGRLTTDHIGFMIGNLAWMALGAMNAVLVLRIGQRLQFGRAAALIGGLGYALWFESTRAEFSSRLEPLGNFLVLLGILAFVTADTSSRRIVAFATGAALGAAVSVKIWYAVPLVIVLGWHLVARRPRPQLAWAVAGSATVILAVNGPFFVLSRGHMWLLVIADQLDRRRGSGNVLQRAQQLASAGQFDPLGQTVGTMALTALAAVLLVAAGALAWRSPPARLLVTLAAAQLTVVLASPSFFPFYSDYLAPAFALTIAAAAATLLRPRVARSARARQHVLAGLAWLPVLLAGGSTLAIDAFNPMLAMLPAPDRTLQQAAAYARCVQSDTPMALIQLDVLSHDLADHCQVWVDVTGRTYAAPLEPTGTVDGRPRRRATDPQWQRALLRYLLSGNDVVVVEPKETGIDRSTLRKLDRGAELGSADGYVVRRA